MSRTAWEDAVAAVHGGVRMVATDLDGTLLRRDSSVSAFTVETLRRARDAGLPVVFVTGRPPRWVPPVLEVTGHSGIAVCANGAIVLDLADMRLIDVHPIPGDAVAEAVRVLRSELPGVTFAVEYVTDAGGTAFAHEVTYRTHFPEADVPRGPDILRLAEGHRVVKILARIHEGEHVDRSVDEVLDLTLTHVQHLVTPTHSVAGDVLIEMSAVGVSKGAALARQAREHGIEASSVAAVGDMPNDVPMIAWAGLGLAVETAHPAALAAADAELPSPADDGVARLVAALLDA